MLASHYKWGSNELDIYGFLNGILSWILWEKMGISCNQQKNNIIIHNPMKITVFYTSLKYSNMVISNGINGIYDLTT